MDSQKILAGSWGKARAQNSLILYFNFLLDKKSKYFSVYESASDTHCT